jgi:L-arabinokinase
VVFYISGHGFGHASRVIEVINALGAALPQARVVVRTSAARWLLDVTLRVAADVAEVTTDVGVIQRDSLHEDIAATTRAAAAFYDTSAFGPRADEEAAALQALGASLVVADLPPLALEAAHRAGVPSVALGNFTWDWIYEGYPALTRQAPHVVPAIRAAHAHAGSVLRLPMWGGFEGWTCPITDVPFVARHAARAPEEVRAYLGVPDGRRMALASFGGLGIADLNLAALGSLADWTVVTTGHALGWSGSLPDGIRIVDDRAVYGAGFRYEDLVRAADIVVTKPGYGIIAECVANGTALLYTSRGDFAEYPVLAAAMPRVLRCRFIGHDDLYAGRWATHLDALLDQPPPPESPATNGAVIAAAHLARLLDVPSRIP